VQAVSQQAQALSTRLGALKSERRDDVGAAEELRTGREKLTALIRDLRSYEEHREEMEQRLATGALSADGVQRLRDLEVKRCGMG